MTAKRKPGGKLARLSALEDRARERAEAVEAVKEDQASWALDGLSAEDRAAWWACADCYEDAPDRWAQLCRVTAHLEDGGLPLPGRDALARAVPLSPDAQTVGRWAAAWWRFEAQACRVIGGAV